MIYLFIIGIVVRNTLVMYDRERSKIGFWKTNCSELWERLHTPAPPAMAPAPDEKNFTEVPSSLPPSKAPDYVLPGLLAGNFFSYLYLLLISAFRWRTLSLFLSPFPYI